MSIQGIGLGQPAAVADFPQVEVSSSPLYDLTKRAIDLSGAVMLLLMLLPFLAIIGLAVLVDSGWPIFYRGVRVGRSGEKFGVVKFRTMRAGTGDSAHKAYIHQLMMVAPGQEQERGVFKVPGDTRITRVGAVLRKTSVDELPQLWNVVRGQMSLVGPRPDVEYAVADYEPWMYARLSVLPGMTGLWQVSGRSRLSLRDMLRLDVEYVQRRSVALDVQILGRTLPAVISVSDSA